MNTSSLSSPGGSSSSGDLLSSISSPASPASPAYTASWLLLAEFPLGGSSSWGLSPQDWFADKEGDDEVAAVVRPVSPATGARRPTSPARVSSRDSRGSPASSGSIDSRDSRRPTSEGSVDSRDSTGSPAGPTSRGSSVWLGGIEMGPIGSAGFSLMDWFPDTTEVDFSSDAVTQWFTNTQLYRSADNTTAGGAVTTTSPVSVSASATPAPAAVTAAAEAKGERRQFASVGVPPCRCRDPEAAVSTGKNFACEDSSIERRASTPEERHAEGRRRQRVREVFTSRREKFLGIDEELPSVVAESDLFARDDCKGLGLLGGLGQQQQQQPTLSEVFAARRKTYNHDKFFGGLNDGQSTSTLTSSSGNLRDEMGEGKQRREQQMKELFRDLLTNQSNMCPQGEEARDGPAATLTGPRGPSQAAGGKGRRQEQVKGLVRDLFISHKKSVEGYSKLPPTADEEIC